MATLEALQLRKDYGTLVAVRDVSFSVGAGEVVGLVGPNGAGKTTLLRMLATLLEPTSGSARVMGHDIRSGQLDVRRVIGYLPDFFNLYNDLRIWEVLTFFAEAHGIPAADIPAAVDRTLDFVKLGAKRDDFVRHLSRGMVQRMGVAARLVHDPSVFLLDEPASGLDPRARIDLRDILRRLSSEGKSVIVSSHILSELADFCTHVGIMDHGRMLRYSAVSEMGLQATGTRRFRVRVLDNVERAVAQLQAHRPEAQVDRLGRNDLIVEAEGDMQAWADLLKALVESGLPVVDFHEEGSPIEDAFMQIAGDDL